MKAWLVLALLASAFATSGCATERASGTAPSTSSATGSSPSLEGVVMEVVHTSSGKDHRLDATVRNDGLHAFYYLWVPQCGLEPWSDGMVGPQGTVQPREPEGHCQPCGRDALSPGESLSRSFAWDERVWDFDDEGMERAPHGRYEWTVTFRAELDEGDVCGGERAVHATIELAID